MSSNEKIFLTTENLAFSMPLILVCSSYAYFKYVPLEYGIPALAGLAVIIFIKGQFKARRDQKLETMDATDIDDLALELEGDDGEATKKKEEEEKSLAKKKARVAERLAAEQRKAEKAAKRNQGKKKKGDDEDDIDAAVFAKGSRNKKKNK